MPNEDYRGPERRQPSYIPDHHHPGLWTRREHERFDDRLAAQLHELRKEVHALSSRLSWLLGGLAVLTFIIGVIAPLIQTLLGVPQPPTP